MGGGIVEGLLDANGNNASSALTFEGDEINLYFGKDYVRFSFFELSHKLDHEIVVLDTSLDSTGSAEGIGLGSAIFGLGIELMRMSIGGFDQPEVVACVADGSQNGQSSIIAKKYGFEKDKELQARLNYGRGDNIFFLKLR